MGIETKKGIVVMKTYILVHGAWHSSWYWRQVIPVLQQAGHQVIADNLPGHDPEDFRPELMTLDHYTKAVSERILQMPGKVHLVGHSMGGLIISQVAEMIPDRIERLVYIAGFIPKSGQNLLDTIKDQMKVGSPFEFSEDKKMISIRPELARNVFYNTCPDEVAEYAIAKLNPQATLAFVTPLKTTMTKFGSVKKTYIECTLDNALWPITQQQMYTEAKCDHILKVDSDHFPMLSNPAALNLKLLYNYES